MNHDQQLGEHEARIMTLEETTRQARVELREDLGEIKKKLDDIASWQAAHHDVTTLNARVTSLEADRDKVVGGWKVLALLATAAAAAGGAGAWVAENVLKHFGNKP